MKTWNLELGTWNLRRRRPRRGIVLLLVVSLLALFVLLGATFTLVALHALNASKYEIKIQQYLDDPTSEMDFVMGQILYDTQARTVLQYHSLLRDLYGYDADNFLQPVNYSPVPQFREAFQGTVIPTDLSPTTAPPTPAGTVASTYMPRNAVVPAAVPGGGQLFSFIFALPPFSATNPASLIPVDPVTGGPRWHALTQLSTIPNYYVGRVITFTSGPAANHSARIVAYNPVSAVISGQTVFFNMHQPNSPPNIPAPTTLWNTNPASFFPAYGQFIIETIESKLNGVLTPNPGDSFVVNGAPFNGAGAGYDPITGNIDAMVAHRQAIQQATANGQSLGNFYGYNPANNPSPPAPNEYVALLPNYASYEPFNTATSNLGTSVVFDWQTQFDGAPVVLPGHPAGPEWFNPASLTQTSTVGNKVRATSTIDVGGMDESWDAPDFQNMFLAMVPPRAAEAYAIGIANSAPTKFLPIIPSFHRPELLNYWVNWIIINIFENPALNHKLTRVAPPGPGLASLMNIIAYPYGADGIRGTSDDPLVAGQGGTSLTIYELDRIYNIIHGCLFRPSPMDHPNFTGSNPNLAVTGGSYLSTLLAGAGSMSEPTNVANPAFIGGTVNPLLYDVDNDGDGLPDAIWIDPGLPIVTMPNGKRAKRLAAITIKDLDGRINVNAHGNLAQVAGPPLLPNYPFTGSTGLLPSMVSLTYQPPPQPNANYAYTVGLGVVQNPASPTPVIQTFPRGLGFGPAEVDFSNILGYSPFNAGPANVAIMNAYRSVLTARYVSNRVNAPFVNAAGASSAAIAIADSLAFDPPVGNPGAILGTGAPFATPGIPYFRDFLSAIKHNGVPNDYSNYLGLAAALFRLEPSLYASPPDVWGRGAVLMDVGGQPLMMFMGQGPQTAASFNAVPNLGEMVDSPYEMRLSGEDDGADSPYTAAELERVLRYHDPDSTELSQRLLIAPMLTGAAPANPLATAVPGIIDASHRRREMISTLSSSIPAPAARMPQEARVNGNIAGNMPSVGSTSILDLYRAKLIAGGTAPALVPVVMQQIVPWEFFKGQKFDLNRWLGDGVDNDNPPDGVRDDGSDSVTSALGMGAPPEFAFAADPIGTLNHLPPAFFGVLPAYPSSNILRDGVLVRTNTGTNAYADAYWAKQIYARHLFCLAMLLLPDDPSTLDPISGRGTGPSSSYFIPNFLYDGDARNNAAANRKLLIRRIAQWAINCVDFRDPDTAMTPFEFDYNPWDGWDVDGFIGIAPGPDGAWGNRGVDDNSNVFIDDRAEAGTVGTDDINSPDDFFPIRGLVWGMETPDLLISETLALHDRRVKDTDSPGGGQKKVTDMMSPDDDLDQFRVPQGSVFVELYSPRPKQWGGQLTNNKPPSGPLDLAYRSPHPVTGAPNTGYPLWRLAFSRLTKIDPANPANLASVNPESMTVDPLIWNGTRWIAPMSAVNFSVANPASTLQVDRFAYFCDASGLLGTSAEGNASFYGSVTAGNSLLMQAGQYAVVGPRPLTYLGSQNLSGVATPQFMNWAGNSPQYIQLGFSATSPTDPVIVYDSTGSKTTRSSVPATTADMQQPLAIICDKADPSGTLTYRIGMNLSEPMITATGPDGISYYAPPITTAPQAPATDLTNGPNGTGKPTPGSIARNYDFYADPDQQSGFPDQPSESAAAGHSSWPIVRETMQQTGTYFDCSSVLLQRLADATLPYNPTPYDINGNADPNYRPGLPVNPYITVDWSTIDLHVISGEEDATKLAFNGQDLYYGPTTTTPYYFRSRQRGYLNSAAGLIYSSNPWPPLLAGGVPGSNNGISASWKTPLTGFTTTNYFGINLTSNNSLTNHPATTNYSGYPYANPFNPSNSGHSLGSINSTVDYPIANGIPLSVNTPYYGEPITPIPWLNWNNRPFSNAMELLSVPAASSSRVFLEMTPDYPYPAGGAVIPVSPYNDLNNLTNPTALANASCLHWPFGHLLNLFYDDIVDTSSVPTGTNPPTPPAFPNAVLSSIQSSHLYRLLDFVEVPSPFSGAERWYQPASFLGSAPGNFQPLYSAIYQPPFNKLSRFRDPGKINLNTIFDFVDADLSNPPLGSMGQPECMWDALVGQFPGMRRIDGFLNKLILSRQGDGGSPYVMNASYPTRFASPFRSADSADLMPNVPSGSFAVGTSMRAAFPASATLLRPDPSVAPPQPLFQINRDNAQFAQWFDVNNNTATSPNYLPGRLNMPGTIGLPANAHDINRNPYFRYQALQKIGNSVTTNSNCFAIWITIGYFEVEENFVTPAGSQTGSVIYDAAHPDGFRLGQEIGIDTGEVTRHRGFYIVDRSIPVGFVPGSRLNTDDCILVRRLIE